MTTLVVMAKGCVPGRVKTRLHPPISLEDAARIIAKQLHGRHLARPLDEWGWAR